MSRVDLPLLGILGASAALQISHVPWEGPLAPMRVCYREKRWHALPTPKELASSQGGLMLSMRREGVVMIEGGAASLPEEEILAGLRFAQEQGRALLEGIETLGQQAGVKKMQFTPPEPPEFAALLEEAALQSFEEALDLPEKQSRLAILRQARRAAYLSIEEQLTSSEAQKKASIVLHNLEARLTRQRIVSRKLRLDGRAPGEIRPISCEVGWLRGTHGSALFTRGETQALVSLTLGAEQEQLLVESLEGVRYERFFLHYNFPPYSVGEVRPLRGVGRREVGHGALARRALAAVLPRDADFPHTIRLLSEISESNGSSSMATICGGSLALMDGGVPLSAPVAGIAMGLISEGDELVVLSDIQGAEDHLGDMDLKLAGTASGVTAVQMDNKLGSLSAEALAQAFSQAAQGRREILERMAETLAAPSNQVKPNAPAFATLNIPPARVRDLIGPGGKVIQEIQRRHACRIDVNDEGLVRISAASRTAVQAAREAVMGEVGDLEVGDVLDGVVTSVRDFGVFVRARGKEGLVHVSEWQDGWVEKITQHVTVGEAVQVKVLAPDRQGRLRFSRKAVGA